MSGVVIINSALPLDNTGSYLPKFKHLYAVNIPFETIDMFKIVVATKEVRIIDLCETVVPYIRNKAPSTEKIKILQVP